MIQVPWDKKMASINSRAALTAITKNYGKLVNMLSPPSEWAVKFNTERMIAPSTFEKATNTAAYISQANKAINMLQDVERYIRASNPNIFRTLVSLIYEEEVRLNRNQEMQHPLTDKLIETYKANGGGDEIDSALRIGTDPNDDNRVVPPPDPNGPRYRLRQEPQPASLPVEPTQTGPPNQPPPPVVGWLTKVLVGSFVVLAGLILAALVVRSVMHSQSTQPHIVVPDGSTSEEEEIMITPCGSIEVDYIKSQPLMRVLEESFSPHMAGAWRLVGTSLGVPGHFLDLYQDDMNNQRDKLREVIVYWLKGNGRDPHTLGTLARAIKMADHPVLANKLLQHPVLCNM